MASSLRGWGTRHLCDASSSTLPNTKRRKLVIGPVLSKSITEQPLSSLRPRAQPRGCHQWVLRGAELPFSECRRGGIPSAPCLCSAVLLTAFVTDLPPPSAHLTATQKQKLNFVSIIERVVYYYVDFFFLSEGLLFVLGGGVWLQPHLSVCVHVSRISMVLTFPLQEFEECSII